MARMLDSCARSVIPCPRAAGICVACSLTASLFSTPWLPCVRNNGYGEEQGLTVELAVLCIDMRWYWIWEN
jgi:hypothetical protein